MELGRDGKRRVGKFGWKADVASLEEMIAVAFANELGITSPLATRPDRAVRYQDATDRDTAVDDDGGLVAAIKAYLASLRFPKPERKTN